MDFSLGGVIVSMLVDSGAPPYVITLTTFKWIQQIDAKLLNVRDSNNEPVECHGYGSADKIQFVKAFEAEIKVPGEQTGV